MPTVPLSGENIKQNERPVRRERRKCGVLRFTRATEIWRYQAGRQVSAWAWCFGMICPLGYRTLADFALLILAHVSGTAECSEL